MAFRPLFMKDVLFQVSTTDYAAQLSSVLFESSSDQVDWSGLKPDSKFTESTPPHLHRDAEICPGLGRSGQLQPLAV